MQDYSKLIKALRCKRADCDGCDLAFFDKDEGWMCQYVVAKDDAADAIEELLSFAHYVANKVTMSDEDWEDYHEAFTEVACRKLVKLGVISIEDDMYVYRQEVQG